MGLNIKYLTIILMVKYFIYEPCISRSLKVFYDSKAAYAAGGLSRRRHMRQCSTDGYAEPTEGTKQHYENILQIVVFDCFR